MTGTPASQHDALHRALAAVLSDYHWRAFCDSWLAIGFVATLENAGCSRKAMAAKIGRVLRKPIRKR